MFDVVTPDTMMLTLRTITWAGRTQLSVGMVAYIDLADPHVTKLLPYSALHAFRQQSSWLRHIASSLPTPGSQYAVFGMAYAPEDALQDTWKVSASVGALRVSSVLPSRDNAHAASERDDHTNVRGVGPIRLSAKSGRRGLMAQAAPELIGNESITIHHMHPQHAVLQGKLPGLRARCFIKMRVGSRDVVRKLDSTLEKLWLFPNSQTGVVRYRALMPLDILGGTFDVERLVAGWEAIDAPNPSARFYLDLLNAPHTARPGGDGAIPPDWVESRCWHTGGAPKDNFRRTSPFATSASASNTSDCAP